MRLPPRMASLSASLRKDAFKTRSTVTGQTYGRSVPYTIRCLRFVAISSCPPVGRVSETRAIACGRAVTPPHAHTSPPGSQKSNRRPICIVRGGKAAVGTRKLLLRRFPVGAA